MVFAFKFPVWKIKYWNFNHFFFCYFLWQNATTRDLTNARHCGSSKVMTTETKIDRDVDSFRSSQNFTLTLYYSNKYPSAAVGMEWTCAEEISGVIAGRVAARDANLLPFAPPAHLGDWDGHDNNNCRRKRTRVGYVRGVRVVECGRPLIRRRRISPIRSTHGQRVNDRRRRRRRPVPAQPPSIGRHYCGPAPPHHALRRGRYNGHFYSYYRVPCTAPAVP